MKRLFLLPLTCVALTWSVELHAEPKAEIFHTIYELYRNKSQFDGRRVAVSADFIGNPTERSLLLYRQCPKLAMSAVDAGTDPSLRKLDVSLLGLPPAVRIKATFRLKLIGVFYWRPKGRPPGQIGIEKKNFKSLGSSK